MSICEGWRGKEYNLQCIKLIYIIQVAPTKIKMKKRIDSNSDLFLSLTILIRTGYALGMRKVLMGRKAFICVQCKK